MNPTPRKGTRPSTRERSRQRAASNDVTWPDLHGCADLVGLAAPREPGFIGAWGNVGGMTGLHSPTAARLGAGDRQGVRPEGLALARSRNTMLRCPSVHHVPGAAEGSKELVTGEVARSTDAQKTNGANAEARARLPQQE